MKSVLETGYRPKIKSIFAVNTSIRCGKDKFNTPSSAQFHLWWCQACGHGSFKNEQFDLIFCNKVFHHFVTNTYSETLHMLELCMNKLKHQLSKNGQLCILDYFYDGLIVDWFPSWMIYRCTSQKKELLVKIFKRLGANSAGNGVCFQSEKMWCKLINCCGLHIIVFEKGPEYQMAIIKQIAFLSHKPIEDCIFICSKE